MPLTPLLLSPPQAPNISMSCKLAIFRSRLLYVLGPSAKPREAKSVVGFLHHRNYLGEIHPRSLALVIVKALLYNGSLL